MGLKNASIVSTATVPHVNRWRDHSENETWEDISGSRAYAPHYGM